MKTRLAFLALAIALVAPGGADADEAGLAVELMKLNLSGNPVISEARTLAPGATQVYELPSPGMSIVMNVKATWTVPGLPGQGILELALLSQNGATVASRTGGPSVTVTGQINPSNLRFKIRVKNTGSLPVAVLKLAIGGRAGTPPSIDPANRRRVVPSPSPTPRPTKGGND